MLIAASVIAAAPRCAQPPVFDCHRGHRAGLFRHSSCNEQRPWRAPRFPPSRLVRHLPLSWCVSTRCSAAGQVSDNPQHKQPTGPACESRRRRPNDDANTQTGSSLTREEIPGSAKQTNRREAWRIDETVAAGTYAALIGTCRPRERSSRPNSSDGEATSARYDCKGGVGAELAAAAQGCEARASSAAAGAQSTHAVNV